MVKALNNKPDDQLILYLDGEECGHAGCRMHLSHPCEKCGRIGAQGIVYESRLARELRVGLMINESE